MIQVASTAVVTFLVIFFLDRNYRVLPSAIHEYMPQHHAGLVITDITVTKCSVINPFSSCRLDPETWHRVEKDLYLGRGLFSSAYLHVRRKREEELVAAAASDRVVMDVSVGRLDPGASVKGQADERWEARPAGLWIKRSSKLHASDSKKAITGVDVLFGEDAVEARGGWSITGTPLLLDAASGAPVAHLTVRRGSQHETTKPALRVAENGRFKVMQLADLHLSTGVGHCREAVPPGYHAGQCEADPRTLDFVSRVLDQEKPDLVVLSGDQVNGDTAPDVQTVGCSLSRFRQYLLQNLVPSLVLAPTNIVLRRPSSNMHPSWPSTRFPTSQSLATTTTRARSRAPRRCLLSRLFPTRSRKLGPPVSTA